MCLLTYSKQSKRVPTQCYLVRQFRVQDERRSPPGQRIPGPLQRQHIRTGPDITEGVFISKPSTNWKSKCCLYTWFWVDKSDLKADKNKTLETYKPI